jgi:hypothetical protein
MLASVVATSMMQRLASVPFAYWLLWCGSAALSIGLILLLRTRWGQSRPIQKCALLSLLVHALLACLAMTVRVVVGDGGGGGIAGAPIRVRIVEEMGTSLTVDAPAPESPIDPAPGLLELPPAETEKSPENEVATVADKAVPADALVENAPAETSLPIAALEPTADKHPAVPVEESTAPSISASQNVAVENPASQSSSSTTKAVNDASETIEATPVASHSLESPRAAAASSPAADTYALRNTPGRLGLIERQGGNAQTEAAVAAALAWLAHAQSADGRWDADHYGAGQEQSVLGHNRGGAGRNADTGVSALAILAFLGAGHSHVQGDYRTVVATGLDFLARSQAADGSLFGDATLYAQMYCHSMAAFALAEAQAMTGDRRWESAVVKAIHYSLRAQHATSGGWRYRPGDTGDTSQLGWQLMALASAERAGIEIPAHAWTRARRFLMSVQRGAHGGLASYRPDGPHSTSMTAEALYCRLLLEQGGHASLHDAATSEATRQLLAALPNGDRINLYYWYYATLALHHRQGANSKAGEAWTVWNEALTTALVNTQRSDGSHAGSWDTNTMWGGYGGRVYTTAMAAMCLEAYYRYAPARPHWTAARPGGEGSPR